MYQVTEERKICYSRRKMSTTNHSFERLKKSLTENKEIKQQLEEYQSTCR